MAAKAGDNNNGSRKWKPCARKRGESGGESTLGLEHRRNQVFDAAQVAYICIWGIGKKVQLFVFLWGGLSTHNLIKAL